MPLAVLLLIALFLLLLNAFFVLAEFAAVKMRPTQVDELEARGEPRAGKLRHIVLHLDEYLSVCQVGITFASIGLGFVGEPAFARILTPVFGSSAAAHSVAITVSYILISFLHILLGELVPKSVAIRRPEESALRIARPLRFFRALFYPPLVILNGSANFILRLLRLPRTRVDRLPSEDEVRIILARAQRQGRLTFRRLLLLENVFDFGEVRVRDAMIPMEQVYTLRVDRPWEENVKIIETTRRSRYPVLEGEPPRPLGILHVKDLLYSESPWPKEVDLRPLLRRYPVTTPDVLVEDLLADLQRRRAQLVLVQDPRGRLAGIITMEDIVEEIVGVIEDEFETEPSLRISDAINEQRIVLNLPGSTLPDALREILQRVPETELPAPRERIYHAVLARERDMSTYLGHGLGVPHARLENLKAPCLFLGVSHDGVRFGEDETSLAHVVFVLLTSSQAPRDQLRLLARIARLRESDYVWDRLLAAQSPAEILEAIRGEALVTG